MFTQAKKLSVLLITFIISCFCVLAQAEAALPKLTADAALVVDGTTGSVIYEKNADKREYPASITKVMTAILALEDDHLDRFVNVSPFAANVESTDLYAGNRLVMQDLLTAALLNSDNGAATAIGESVARGNITSFVQQMNAKANKIGMRGTHFVNANGMPHNGHYSTARDIYTMIHYAMRNQKFRDLVHTPAKKIYMVNPKNRIYNCSTTNALLKRYPGMVGGKTGTTRAAGYCFTGLAERDGREVYVVVLHAGSDTARFREAAALLDYGFEKLAQDDQQKLSPKYKKKKNKKVKTKNPKAKTISKI